MRFRVEMVPIVLVVSASAMTMPLVTACKKDPLGSDASTTGPIIIQRKEEIPPVLAGVPIQYVPPQPSTSASASPPPPPAPAPTPTAPANNKQGGAAAAAAPAPAPTTAAATPTAIAIVHNRGIL